MPDPVFVAGGPSTVEVTSPSYLPPPSLPNLHIPTVALLVFSRSQLYNEGYQAGYDDGYQAGYDDGYQVGMQDGYQDGYEAGHAEGLQDGYSNGYSQGHQAGYQDGYAAGVLDGTRDACGQPCPPEPPPPGTHYRYIRNNGKGPRVVKIHPTENRVTIISPGETVKLAVDVTPDQVDGLDLPPEIELLPELLPEIGLD